MYREIKNKITPTIRTTNAPTIPTTVKGRFFDNFWDEPVGSVIKNVWQVFHYLHYVIII